MNKKRVKVSSHNLFQLLFLSLIVVGLSIVVLNLNEIREIDEEIQKLEERELILIQDITEIEKQNTAEELKRLERIEELERKELERLRSLN